jgi:hypothetical protein
MRDELIKLENMGIDIGGEIELLGSNTIEAEDIVKWLDIFWNCVLTLVNKNSDLALKVEKEI